MEIDLSKLSPMSRRRILQAMMKAAGLESVSLKEDLEWWPKSDPEPEAHAEMVAWKEALHELHRACNKMHLAS